MFANIKTAFNYAFDKFSPVLIGWTIGLYVLGDFSSESTEMLSRMKNFERFISLVLICFVLAFIFKLYKLRKTS